MRNLLMTCTLAVVVYGWATNAAAGEHAAPVSQATLASMGLGSMQPISDTSGSTVRGKFTMAHVFGPTYNITHAHFAAGSNLSGGILFSGGGSFAVAH